MSTLVTNNGPGHAIPGENIFIMEFNDSSLNCSSLHSLHPLRHIVNTKEDVLISKEDENDSIKSIP